MALVSFGTRVTFLTSGFTAAIRDWSFSGEERDAIDVTHQLSPNGVREFDPGALLDAGELELAIDYDPDDHPPTQGSKEQVRVEFPLKAGQTTPAEAQFPAFITSAETEGSLGEKVTGTIKLKIAGEVTRTPGV